MTGTPIADAAAAAIDEEFAELAARRDVVTPADYPTDFAGYLRALAVGERATAALFARAAAFEKTDPDHRPIVVAALLAAERTHRDLAAAYDRTAETSTKARETP